MREERRKARWSGVRILPLAAKAGMGLTVTEALRVLIASEAGKALLQECGPPPARAASRPSFEFASLDS